MSELMTRLDSRMEQIQSPLIPVIGEMIQQSSGTISLGQGIVFYPPPPQTAQSLIRFLADPKNHCYKAVQGIPELREKIKEKLAQDNQILITDENDILVTAGSNMAFINAIFAMTQPGDEIILQTPYYFNHEMAIRMASCTPIFVPTDEQYQLQFNLIEQAITPKTRAIVTISPNNPTGVIYLQESLKKVNQLCQEQGIYHISDEAYEYFTYDQNQHFSPASFAGSTPHTLSLFSLSKSYGFASWRIGYMVVPKALVFSLKKVQDTILICPPVVSQYGALGALEIGKRYCYKHLKKIDKMRKIVVNSLSCLGDKCQWATPQGAFYLFLKLQTSKTSFEVAKELIFNHKVALIPGGTFGIEQGCYLRLAYGSLEEETVTEGMARLTQGLHHIL